ncbi:hypothetical protein CKO38_01685 [Rhodospirillum rubrum]|nr:hypothetical protein [Rhodospirillum rubrum]MBK1675408.1 hypothetical protein [Rhodospirillum rubrum]
MDIRGYQMDRHGTLRVISGAAPAGAGGILVEAARGWARRPGLPGGFTPAVARQVCASGLAAALGPLESLLAVLTVHGRSPLDLSPPGTLVFRKDELLLARVLEGAVAEGLVESPAVARLGRRLSPRGEALLRRTLGDLVRASHLRATRAPLPCGPAYPLATVLAAE